MILWHDKDRIGAWAMERMASKRTLSQPFEAIGQEIGGVITAAAVFDRFIEGDATVGLAVDRRATPAFVRAVFAYVFGQMDCRRMSCEIAVSNARSIRLAQRLGFTLEGVKRAATPENEVLQFGLLREENRWA